VVQIAASLWVYRFEASRPDATEDAQGVVANRACSRRGVLPWTNVTLDDARAACQAADMDVCTLDEWLMACEADQGCGWGYTPASGTCNDYEANGGIGCNGHDITASPGSADNDAVAPTGAFDECYADHPAGPVWDLSGNAKEWAREPMGDPTQTPLRGGSYSSLPGGMRCDFDFSIADGALRLANVGFRCCGDSDPNE
jgi:formylglycine-generating enzyme required for sulfatase activity